MDFRVRGIRMLFKTQCFLISFQLNVLRNFELGSVTGHDDVGKL